MLMQEDCWEIQACLGQAVGPVLNNNNNNISKGWREIRTREKRKKLVDIVSQDKRYEFSYCGE